MCNRLQVKDIEDILDKINTMKVTVQSHSAMEKVCLLSPILQHYEKFYKQAIYVFLNHRCRAQPR